MTLLHLAARPMLASLFVAGGFNTLRNPEGAAGAAAPLLDRVRTSFPALPKDDELLVRVNAGVQVAAGGLLAVGKLPRLSAIALVASMVPTTLAGHAYWEHEDEDARAQQRTQFLKNAAVTGGLLAAVNDAFHRSAAKKARAARTRARTKLVKNKVKHNTP